MIDNCYGKENKSLLRPILGVTIRISGYRTELDANGMIRKIEEITVDEVSVGVIAAGVIEVGDILLSVEVGGETHSVERMHHLTDAMLYGRLGETVRISLLRGGETVTVSLTLTESALTAY